MRLARLSVLSVVSAVIVVAALWAAPAAQAAPGQYVLCMSNASGPMFYLSADFQIDVPVAPDAKSADSDGGASRRALDTLQREFFEYLKADRGYRDSSAYPVRCQGKPSAAELAAVRELLHQRFAQLKFVETGWKPGVKPTATPTPSGTPAPSAPPAAKPSTAARPSAAAKPATSPATAPAASQALESPPKYSYCNGYGSPAGSSTAKQHLYISQAFQIPPGERPSQTEEAFEKYLGAAHPGETISTSCLAPSALEAAQNNRQTRVDRQRRQPAKLDVVEVEWKR